MYKNLFRDWSKSDFGYALKIIANIALITAVVAVTLNVSSSHLWLSIIFGIVFLAGSFYVELCVRFKSDTYVGNAFYFAVFCLVIFTFCPPDSCLAYVIIFAVSILFSLFRFPLGEIMWGKKGWRRIKNKINNGKKILDYSVTIPMLVLITCLISYSIREVNRRNDELFAKTEYVRVISWDKETIQGNTFYIVKLPGKTIAVNPQEYPQIRNINSKTQIRVLTGFTSNNYFHEIKRMEIKNY